MWPAAFLGVATSITCGALPANASTLEISACVVKRELLVGEPVVLHVRFSGTAPVKLRGDLTDPYLLRVLVDRGQGFVQFREKKWHGGTPVVDTAPPTGGSESREYVLSYDANTSDWTFPRPGTYSLAVEYAHPELGLRRSNSVTVAVRSPSGDEQAVHDELRRLGPEFISVNAPNWLGRAAGLVSRYPTSVYLQKERLNDLAARLSRVHNGYDPNQQPSEPGQPLETPDVTSATVMSRKEALVSLADSISEVPGPFQPLALYQSGLLHQDTGDDETAQAIFRRIVKEFPDRLVASAAREELADQQGAHTEGSSCPDGALAVEQ
jgi:hypothetical protein